ncbi:AraC family transcriptional regulator [Pedobacter sp.]|jgi:AraC family transcriptional regulator|uniref:AraC family transcriptional regulator n=1 Tax=Pedobacter sp. TaxID=1411316 RepID=UPI002C5BFFEB|nr:AraC family transcriptional regulator [Pedobacter sp.]HWW41651.1 AraC family transcriptional regulator [Pedobacter sp.]
MSIPIKFSSGRYVGSKVSESSFRHIITTETVFPQGHTSDWHFHENPHFSHILSGGSKEIRTNLTEIQTEGSSLYYYPGIPHQNTSYLAGTRIFNVEFEKEFFNLNGLTIPEDSKVIWNKKSIASTGLIKILKEHYYNDIHSQASTELLCINLLAEDHQKLKHYPEWTKQIIEVLNDHWNTPLLLSRFAEHLNIHPVTLSKYFSRYFSCTLGEYFRKLKIDRSLSIIRQNRYSLTDIAYQCGFTDQAHFTKTFRQFTGMTPFQYKKI